MECEISSPDDDPPLRYDQWGRPLAPTATFWSPKVENDEKIAFEWNTAKGNHRKNLFRIFATFQFFLRKISKIGVEKKKLRGFVYGPKKKKWLTTNAPNGVLI